MIGARIVLYGCLLLLPLTAQGTEKAAPDEHIYISKSYHFVPGTPPGDPEIGQALCGSRCNALSGNYLNYIEPGGWRLIKIASDRELTVPLNNPFLGGECVCVVDEYQVKENTFNAPPTRPAPPPNSVGKPN